jgi:hypothetical protein
VDRARELGKRVLPSGAVAWYRRQRRRVFRTFGGPITPRSLVKVTARATGLTALVRSVALKVLAPETADRLRRRRALRGYLRALSYQLVPDRLPLGAREGAFRPRDAFYARVIREDLERTDAIIQARDRRIEGISARATERLMAVRSELEAIDRDVERLSGEPASDRPRPG